MSNTVELIIKYLIVISNLFLGVIGLFIFSLGVYIQIIFNVPGLSSLAIGSYINIFFGNDYFNVSMFLVITGLFIILYVIIACVGVIMENICLLKTGISLLVLMLVAECGSFVGTVIWQSQISNYVETNMSHHHKNNSFEKMNSNGTEMNLRDEWDWIQETWECCAINQSVGNTKYGDIEKLKEETNNTTVSGIEEIKDEKIPRKDANGNTQEREQQEIIDDINNQTFVDRQELTEGKENETVVDTEKLGAGISNSILGNLDNTEKMEEHPKWNMTSKTEPGTNHSAYCRGEQESLYQEHHPSCFSVLENKFLNHSLIGGIIFSIALLQIIIIFLVGILIRCVGRRKGFGSLYRRSTGRTKKCESWKLTYSDPNLQQFRNSRMYIDPNMTIYSDPTDSMYSHIVRDRKKISFKAKIYKLLKYN